MYTTYDLEVVVYILTIPIDTRIFFITIVDNIDLIW